MQDAGFDIRKIPNQKKKKEYNDEIYIISIPIQLEFFSFNPVGMG